MANYTRQLLVNFGSAYGSLATVGYKLPGGSRITSGVTEVVAGTGSYTVAASIAQGTQGVIQWDTGGSPAVYAFEELNPAGATEISVSSGKVPATLASTDVTGTISVNASQLGGQTVTASAGITFGATVGTSTYGGGDTSGTTTLLARLTLTRAANLDNLDAAISTRSTFAGGAVASVTGAVGSITGIAFPTNFNLLAIDGTGKVTYANAATDLSGIPAAVWNATTRTLSAFAFQPTIGGYASGQDPATLVWAATARTLSAFGFQPNVGGYASGQDPATLLLATPANKLATDGSGRVTVGSNADKTGYTINTVSTAFNGIVPNAGFFTNAPTGGGGGTTQVVVSVPSALPGYAPPAGDLPSIRLGDTYSAQLTGIGDLTGRTKLWITAKVTPTNTDARADFQIEETAGLIVLSKATPISGQEGSLTVDDADNGDVTIVLSAAATGALLPRFIGFDVQVERSNGDVKTLTVGNVSIVTDVTHTPDRP